MKQKTFDSYGLVQRVGEELEADINAWTKKSQVKMEDIKPVTTSLPDRTLVS